MFLSFLCLCTSITCLFLCLCFIIGNIKLSLCDLFLWKVASVWLLFSNMSTDLPEDSKMSSNQSFEWHALVMNTFSDFFPFKNCFQQQIICIRWFCCCRVVCSEANLRTAQGVAVTMMSFMFPSIIRVQQHLLLLRNIILSVMWFARACSIL